MSHQRQNFLYIAAIVYSISLYGTMATMSIGAGIAGIAWLMLRWGSLGEDMRIMRHSPVFVPTVFFAMACLWSLFWAKATGLTFFEHQPSITWDDTRKTWHLFFPFILFAIFSALPQAKVRRVVRAWFFLGLVSAVLGVIQHYVPLYEPMELPHVWDKEYMAATGWLAQLRGRYHATGLAGFHLSYASIMAFPSTMGLALMAVLYRRERLGRRTLIAAGVSLVFFVATLLTYSKIAWVAMPLAMLLIALIGFKGRIRYAIVSVIVASSLVWACSSEVRARFGGSHQTVKDRMEVWAANIEMIRQFPVFGVGWHRNSELTVAYYHHNHVDGFESHAHNNVLDQWASTGLVGLVGFFWLNGVLIWMAFRLYGDNHDLLLRSLGLGLVAGWFCLHLNGLTQSNWWDAKVLHQIGWVTAMTMDGWRRLSMRASSRYGSRASASMLDATS